MTQSLKAAGRSGRSSESGLTLCWRWLVMRSGIVSPSTALWPESM